MKKNTKRITALIIAAMMLASMIPAAFAATGAETVKEKYEFLFTRASHADAFTTQNDKGNLTYTPKDCSLDNTIQGDKWANVNGWYAYGYSVKEDYISYYYDHTASRGGGYIYDPDNDKYPAFMALEILIDEPGTYSPSLTWEAHNQSPYVDVFLIPKIEEDVETWTYTTYKVDPKKACYAKLVGFSPIGTVKMQPTDDSGDVSPKELSPIKIADGDEGSYYLIFVPNGASDTVATTIANAKCYIQPASFTLTRVAAPAEPEQDEELSGAFDDAVVGDVPNDYVAPSVDAIDAEGIVGEPIPVSGGAYEITAPETVGERGNFLYWKKAMSLNEKIVSFERKFNYVPESEGRNILVAVYEGDVATTDAKCYNANGQYLPEATLVEADLPSMAGYGKANAWAQYGNTNVYVAQYEAETPIADIDVTVKGNNTSGGGTNLAYGASVTCKATGENFKCWKKTYGDGTAKIVSREAEYTFKAWEDCTVEAVYEANVNYTGSTLKIIIDNFTAGDETGVMAEFLGLGDNVVEKGIMFVDSEKNENRIAMTTVGNQFSVIADEEGTYKGYVIVEETDGLNLITDGSYEK